MHRLLPVKRIVILLFLLVAFFRANAQPERPDELMVNFLRNPSDALITDPTPDFCWIIPYYQKGLEQTAFQIILGTDSAQVAEGMGDMWNSGKEETSKSCNIVYSGKPLLPYTQYWWAVKYWTNRNSTSNFSIPQAFITGDLRAVDTTFHISNWNRNVNNYWRLENRQRSHYYNISPQKLWEKKPGHYIADFGKAAFGTLKVSFESDTEGDTVWVNLAERAGKNQQLHDNPGMTSVVYHKNHLITKKGEHTYMLHIPRFISHYPNSQVLADHMPEVLPFRYAEFINVPSDINVMDISQLALFHPFDDEASHFISSNENLNQVWDLCKYTLKATSFLSLYADGNRERMPYEADAYIQQLGHYSVDREYSLARYTWEFLIFNPSWPTEWLMHNVMMAWQDYMYTGNKDMLRKYYRELKRKSLLSLEEDPGLISTRTGKVTEAFLDLVHYKGKTIRDIVDWPPGRTSTEDSVNWRSKLPMAGERDNYEFTTYNTVVNAFYFHVLNIMKNIASVLDYKDEEKLYVKKIRKVRRVFNANFFDDERKIYVDGIESQHASLHANMFPLAFGLVKKRHLPSVIDHIKSKGMACSVYGAQYLLEGLFEYGESEYALSLMEADNTRSWMNMINTGATMTTEAWDEKYKPNLTWNHAWGTAPANIIMRKIAGVEPAVAGFEKVNIEPKLNLLDFAYFKIPTVKGYIYMDWESNNSRYDVNVYIPANMHAELKLPGSRKKLLKPGKYSFNVLK